MGENMKRKTLFDPNAVDPRAYESFVNLLELNERRDFCGDEINVFNCALDFERAFSYAAKGSVSGRLLMKMDGIGTVDVHTNKEVSIPVWPEPEVLAFLKCDAKAVVMFEKGWLPRKFAEVSAAQMLDVLIVSANGVPMFNVRRFVHRLCTQFKLPLYIVADNDTWGYFIYSVMKRGLIDPANELPMAAVKDTRFLGMRCKDAEIFKEVKGVKIRQKSYWKYRLAALRKYDCFKSKAWQQEFDAFEKQKGKFEISALIDHKSINYIVHEYLKPKLEQRDYLK